ncbi:methyl-accepting chemotaxis protein [Ensifer sesbaniae]|uniref:methyl-accepting chemotaxis protein n=1 Tax=Ensifer sesbaniae TaxID=1214071 RepID=UPI0015696E68|nr:methyl-accepting chemotaxis protein [Ensifer sesbaniae]NRQ15406.1 Methyl-accepting chemotaxis protein II [Ensifer sesbaniae]
MTATSPSLKRNLSVSQRLATLAGAAIVGFGSVLGVGWYQGSQANDALQGAVAAQNGLTTLDEVRLATTNLVLNAMDSIIDREEGAIQPARAASIAGILKLLEAKSADIKALAGLLGRSDALSTFDADVAELRKAIGTELKTLIEGKASVDDFGRIDDAIDGAGERVATALASLSEAASGLVQTRVAEARAASDRAFQLQVAAGLLAMATLLYLLWFHGSTLRTGILGLRNAMQRVQNGDLATKVEALDRGDEIGAMARSVDLFRLSAIEKQSLEQSAALSRREIEKEREQQQNEREEAVRRIQTAIDSLGRALTQLADGDLAVAIDRPFDGNLDQLRQNFNQTVERLRVTLSSVKENALSIESNGRQMRSAADDLARRTERQAASLEQTSAALDEITVTVRTATQRAEEASRMVGETRTNAEESGRIVGEAIAAMARIESASNEIGKIINVIDEIAFQTNLLALNAGVEAARAGEAGKGFAVVAQEVRELAQRAAGAAKDIKALVSRSGNEVGSGVKLVQATGEALGRIGADVARINEHMTSIVMAAREQSTGLNEISTAVGQLDQMTQQNAAMVEQTNASSHTLAQDAERLTGLVGQFREGHTMQRAMPTSAPAPVAPVARAAVAPVQTKTASAPTAQRPAAKGTGEPVPLRKIGSAKMASFPTPSPAKALMGKLAGAFGNKPGSVPSVTASGENWEEF